MDTEINAETPDTIGGEVDYSAKIAEVLKTSDLKDESADSEEPAEKPKAPAKAAKPAPVKEKPKAEKEEEPEEATEPEPEPEADKEEPKADDKPKTSRAREWNDIRKVKAAAAKEIRELRREQQAFLKEKAEYAQAVKAQRELDELREKDPAEYVKRITKGDIRGLLKKTLETPEMTPEERERAELKAELAELKKWREEREKNETEREKKQREQSEQEAAQATRRGHIEKILGFIDARPEFASLKSIPRPLRPGVAAEARQRIVDEYERSGYEMNILEVLSVIQSELYPQQDPETDLPAQDSGAVETAKPEAKRAPVTLKTATVNARVSAVKDLPMEDRIRVLSAKLTPR